MLPLQYLSASQAVQEALFALPIHVFALVDREEAQMLSNSSLQLPTYDRKHFLQLPIFRTASKDPVLNN